MTLTISCGSTVIHREPESMPTKPREQPLLLPTHLLWATSQVAALARDMNREALEFVRIRSDDVVEDVIIEATNGHILLQIRVHDVKDYRKFDSLLLHWKEFFKWSRPKEVQITHDSGRIRRLTLDAGRHVINDPEHCPYEFPTVQAVQQLFPDHFTLQPARPIAWDPVYMALINTIAVKLECGGLQLAFNDERSPMEMRGVIKECQTKVGKELTEWGKVSLRFILMPIQIRDAYLYWESEYRTEEA
jgi:hypothetical protein